MASGSALLQRTKCFTSEGSGDRITGDAHDSDYSGLPRHEAIRVGPSGTARAVLVPYLDWVTFASAYNVAVWRLDPGFMKTPALRPARQFLIASTLLFLAMNTYSASEKILFDFQTATNTAAWQVVNDDVMGGVSTSSFRLTNGVAVFQGAVSLENNGGFASVRSLPARHDLAGCDSFVVRVRGDGRRYKFTARTEPSFDSAIYQCAFATRKGEWEEHRLPAIRFVATFRGRTLPNEPPLELVKATSVGFLISDQQDGPFQLEVAWIKALPPGIK